MAHLLVSTQFEDSVVTRAGQNQIPKPVSLSLMSPLAARFLCNCRHVSPIWWKRVGVEPKH
jgi:hypothetical protein